MKRKDGRWSRACDWLYWNEPLFIMAAETILLLGASVSAFLGDYARAAYLSVWFAFAGGFADKRIAAIRSEAAKLRRARHSRS